MNKKIIIFDADGMLIRSEQFGTYYHRQNKLPKEAMLPFYKGVFRECIVGKADLKKVIVPWLKKWKWRGSVDQFLMEWFRFEDKTDEKMVGLIKDLRKKSIKCYLATNQEKYRTKYMKEEMGFEKIFDGIFSSSEIGYEKPQKEFYEAILKKIDTEKEKILYTDDNIHNIKEAKKFGLDSYCYQEFEDFLKKIRAKKIKKK